ncbi:uncharacterized protein [Littorina saxatilis]|uniref:uncharacterized protein isoform X2 n=1 Tax=Littorina saxatilis TaxID=31220 RepID=UPI0038B66259
MEKRKGPPDEGADLNRDKDNDGDEGLELLDVTGTSGQNQLTSPQRTTTASNVFLLRSLDASMMGNSQTGFVGFGGGERVIVMDSRGLNFLNSWSQGPGLPGSVHSQQISVENLSPLVSLSSRGSRAGDSSQMPHFVPPGTQGNFPAYPGTYGPACPPNGQCGMPFQNYPAPGPSVPYGPGPYGPTSLPDQVSQHPYDFQGPQQYIHSQGYHDNIQGAPMRGIPPQSYNYGRRPGPGFTADPNANTARYGFPYATNHHQQGFWQNPHGAPPQGQPNVLQQGPMPRGPTGNPPGYQQPKTIRIDTQVDPKFLKLYFANETNGGGKIDGDPVDHRSSGGYVLITFLNAEVAGCLLSRPHRVKGENLRVSLHHETHSETNRTVVVSGPPKLIADEEYLELYFTNREESSGGAVDGIEYDQKDQVTRIVFKDASVAKAVLDQEQHTLDGQRLVVGTSVPKKTKAPAPQPKQISERRAPAFSPRKPQPVRTAQQQGYSSVTQPKQKAPSVSAKNSPTTPTCDKRNTVVHETRQTHAPSTGPRLVVCVRGLDLRATSHEKLFLYFENKRRSGVEQVSCMVRDYRDNVVYISFPTEEDTTKVFSGSHTLDDQKLDVSLGKMPDVMTKTLAARDLPQGINLTSLQDFIQTKTGQTVVSIDDMEGVFLLKFQRNIDLATTQSTLRNELFDGHTILVDPLLVTNKVMVCGLPKTPPVTKQAVEDVFSPFARVIQIELASASGKAVITLQNAQAAETVVGQTLSFRKHALETYLFFDRIGMEFQSTVEPVPSQPDLHEQLQHQLSLQAVQREVTRQPQQANHIQEVKVTSGAPFNPPSQVGLHVPAEARQTKNASDSPLPIQLSETFPATNSSIRTETTAQVNVNETIRGVSLAKQRFCKEKKIGQEFVDRGLKVHYNTDDDCIDLYGKEKDVAEMREVVEMTRDFLQTATHTWDAHLPLEILRSEAVEKAISEACRKEGLDGAIAVTADGFEVAVVYDLQQATRVRDMAAELLIIKAVNTSGTDDGDPNQKARWKQLVSSLQRQNENKIILRENLPSQLLVMGIRETVNDTVKKLEEFLAEHSVAERTFPLPQGDTETLFWEFFGQAQTHLIKDNNIEVKDGRVVVKGNKDVIQTADKLMEDFERNLATIRKKINEPSIQRLTQTPEWKRNCQDIESQHKCKISPENDHSWCTSFAAAPTSPVSDSDVFPSFTNPMARLFQHGVNRQRATGGPVAYKPRIHLHKRADITKDEHQLLVNSTKQNLELNSGKVSRALLIAGGQRIQDECYTKYPHGINIGDVAITEGGKLYCKKLAHCCLPSTLDKEQMKKAVKTNVTKCLEKAEKYQLDSVAFPAIGTGTLQYPPDIVAKAMYEATLAYGLQNPGTTIDDVSFVLLTEDVHNHAVSVTRQRVSVALLKE